MEVLVYSQAGFCYLNLTELFCQVRSGSPSQELDRPEAQSGTVPALLRLHTRRHAGGTAGGAACGADRGHF